MLKLQYFTAKWCSPCKYFGPVLESFVEELKDKVEFVKVDGDEEPELIEKFKIRKFPTIILSNEEGTELLRHVGVSNKQQLKEIFKNVIN